MIPDILEGEWNGSICVKFMNHSAVKLAQEQWASGCVEIKAKLTLCEQAEW